MAIPQRELGTSRPTVGSVGFGAMSFARPYGPSEEVIGKADAPPIINGRPEYVRERAERLAENAGAAELSLTAAEITSLNAISAHGERETELGHNWSAGVTPSK